MQSAMIGLSNLHAARKPFELIEIRQQFFYELMYLVPYTDLYSLVQH